MPVHQLFVRALRTLIGLAILAAPAHAQPEAAGEESGRIPWQISLGLRAGVVQQAFPVIDQVVLAPDAATYLHELSKWSPTGRWPVLIEDDHLAAMFIRRFGPAKVIRLAPVGETAPGLQARQGMIEQVIRSAWGGEAGEPLKATFERRRYVPPGVVIASANDPAWTAAVALAAGRGQPIAWMDGGLGRPNGKLKPLEASRLRDRIDELLTQSGYSFDRLGDAIDAITVCRAMAGRADSPFPPGARPSLPPEQQGGPLAITDVIGRDAQGERYAVTGWIFGDEVRCAYMAMCSLFLPRERISFYNTYPGGEPWAMFGPDAAAAALTAQGYETAVTAGRNMNEIGWRRLLSGGFAGDVIVMTSKGNADFFDLATGRGSPHDVPILTEPAALYLVHSWSLRSPDNRNTVGGRWLERGVYAYVGSVHEPFLSAFVTPMDVVERCVNHAPFHVAARHYPPNPLAGPWKINTIGDPLMLMTPPANPAVPRTAPVGDEGADLGEQVKSLMRACDESEDGAVHAETIATLALLGRDEIAAQLWQLAEQNGCAAPAARAALGPLFRLKQDQAFLRAWEMLPERDTLALDMLWHLMGPRLPSIEDEDTLLLLQSSIRRPQAYVDIASLAAPLARAFGGGHVRGLLERELAQTQDEGTRKRLQQLLQRHAPR